MTLPACTLNWIIQVNRPLIRDMKLLYQCLSLTNSARRTQFKHCRPYAVQAHGTPSLQVFNRHAKYLQKQRAAADVEISRKVDYLKDEVASRLCERLLVNLWF